ncbi:MAG: hypothetical protein ACYDD0_00850 [Candidatus Dormibacteria bacterium]
MSRDMTREEAEARMAAAEAEVMGSLSARTRLRSQAAELGQLRSERDKLLTEVERLRGVVEAARELWRLYDGPANYPLISELGVALAALGGEDG